LPRYTQQSCQSTHDHPIPFNKADYVGTSDFCIQIEPFPKNGTLPILLVFPQQGAPITLAKSFIGDKKTGTPATQVDINQLLGDNRLLGFYKFSTYALLICMSVVLGYALFF